MKIIFNGLEHKEAYLFWVNNVPNMDSYHHALLYTLAICPETRNRIGKIYDIQERMINLEVLNDGWQTSTSRRVCLMAFNLFNGYVDPDDPQASTPYDLFCCSYSRFYFQAIRLRYAEYFPD